ncbi:MAG: hypothetical protein ABI321_00540 [Polyangia bacterium]
MTEERLELVSTTVAWIGDARCGIGNIHRASYVDGTGRSQEGLVVDLLPAPSAGEKERVFSVGKDSSFELGGARWVVLSIEPGTRGRVTLRKTR